MLSRVLSARKLPTLIVRNASEDISTKIALACTTAPRHFVVSITGGCGNMTPDYFPGVQSVGEALKGFDGAILAGGTRMLQVQPDLSDLETLSSRDESKVRIGITEVLLQARQNCPKAVFVGIVPKPMNGRINMVGDMIIVSDMSEGPQMQPSLGKGDNVPFITAVHPDLDEVVLLQQSADVGVQWDEEFHERVRITQALREILWSSLLIAYNGGGTTEREIRKNVELGWPVLLVRGSGGVCDKLASDDFFRAAYPDQVIVVDNDVESIRTALCTLGALTSVQRRGTLTPIARRA